MSVAPFTWPVLAFADGHEKRFRKLLENVVKGTVFKRDEEAPWKCRNCGYVHVGKEPPIECPACQHPQSYYELLAENY